MTEDNKFSGGQAGLLASLTFLIGGAAGAVAINELAPDPAEAQSRMRLVLKDPKKTDELIERLKSESMTQEFLDDPEIMKNLKRLTAAVEGHVQESFEQRIEGLKTKRDLLKDTNPGKDWAEKAVQGTGERSK